MPKRLFPIFFAVLVAAFAALSLMPEKQSIPDDPMDALLYQGLQSQSPVLIQFVTKPDDIPAIIQGVEEAVLEEKVNLLFDAFLAMQYEETVKKYGIPVPGYIIIDGEGTMVIRQEGIVTKESLIAIIQGNR